MTSTHAQDALENLQEQIAPATTGDGPLVAIIVCIIVIMKKPVLQ